MTWVRPIAVVSADSVIPFHQLLIVRRYLMREADLDASRKLPDLVNKIFKMDKESFVGVFDRWYECNKKIINERVHDKCVLDLLDKIDRMGEPVSGRVSEIIKGNRKFDLCHTADQEKPLCLQESENASSIQEGRNAAICFR